MNFKKFFRQLMLFFISSGIGFIIDFSVYYVLVSNLELRVVYANMLSALPAITFVFIISNTKIFDAEKTTMVVKLRKYVIYLLYQCILLVTVSNLGEYMYNAYGYLFGDLITDAQIKIVIKVIITPITMVLNFIVMKFLIENKKVKK